MQERDEYRYLEQLLPAEPQEYFDFPASLFAFVRTASGRLGTWKVEDGFAIYRDQRTKVTLCSFSCSVASLRDFILVVDPYRPHKSLNFTGLSKDDGLNLRKYGAEYRVAGDYSLEQAVSGSKHSSLIKRDYDRGKELYDVTPEVTRGELEWLIETWALWAERRHFMVFKGHYRQYVADKFLLQTPAQFLAFRNRSDGALFGAAGYEVRGSAAQLTFMKHRAGDGAFPTFFWLETLFQVLARHQPSTVFCGSTADTLKQRLNFTAYPSYKIIGAKN